MPAFQETTLLESRQSRDLRFLANVTKTYLHIPLLFGTFIVVKEDVLLQHGKDGCPVVRPAARLIVVSRHVNVNAANDHRAWSNLQSHHLSSVGLAEEEVAPSRTQSNHETNAELKAANTNAKNTNNRNNRNNPARHPHALTRAGMPSTKGVGVHHGFSRRHLFGSSLSCKRDFPLIQRASQTHLSESTRLTLSASCAVSIGFVCRALFAPCIIHRSCRSIFRRPGFCSRISSS